MGMARHKIEVTDNAPQHPRWHVVVDGVIVGDGYGEEGKRGCDALADELRADESKADAVLEAFRHD